MKVSKIFTLIFFLAFGLMSVQTAFAQKDYELIMKELTTEQRELLQKEKELIKSNREALKKSLTKEQLKILADKKTEQCREKKSFDEIIYQAAKNIGKEARRKIEKYTRKV